MRLLHCISTREFAGTERHVVDLTGALARRHDVTLLIGRETRDPVTGMDIADHVSADVHLVRAGRTGFSSTLARLRGFDIVHTHLGRASFRASVLRRGPLVATLHNTYRPRAYGRHDGVICIASWQRGLVPAGQRSVVIGNWLTPGVCAAGDGLRARLGVPVGARLIGAAGRLVPEKGFEGLLRAFALARLADPVMQEAHLVVFGEGPERGRLMALAGDGTGVHLPGYCRDLRGSLPELDGFVLPSRREPFGLVLLEAMAARLPIVATRAGGVMDILCDGTGVLVAPGDVGAMAEALRVLVRRPCRDYDLGGFGLTGQVAKVEAFYRGFL